mgnify:CR=1 FL=1|tara:strand:+ start:1498 stop:2376 length:879 start_codon:yes stop_codon:yes gene_type:complete
MRVKVKHSKIKNTGLIFEFLIRQITADILGSSNKSKALKIVKDNFNENTELGKELALYQALVNEKLTNDKKADYLISEVLSRRSKLNQTQLRRDKYNVIKSIKEGFDSNKFFSSKVSNYKVYASIYKLFEYNTSLSPEEKTESYFNILEYVTTKPSNKDIALNPINEKLKEDEDLRILTYKTLLERFNKKYSILDNSQRNLLKAYINNISGTNSLKEFIESKVPNIKNELKKYSKNIKDDVVKIKLKEAIKSIDSFCNTGNSKRVKDNVVIQTMRYLELLKELKKSGTKKVI